MNMKGNHPRLEGGCQKKYSFQFQVRGTSKKLYTLSANVWEKLIRTQGLKHLRMLQMPKQITEM